jgi:hypothetical protein
MNEIITIGSSTHPRAHYELRFCDTGGVSLRSKGEETLISHPSGLSSSVTEWVQRIKAAIERCTLFASYLPLLRTKSRYQQVAQDLVKPCEGKVFGRARASCRYRDNPYIH